MRKIGSSPSDSQLEQCAQSIKTAYLLLFAKCALLVKRYNLTLVGSLLAVAAFYICIVFAATTSFLPTLDSPVIFYSNQSRQDLKLTFQTALKSAKSSIFLQMYALTDPDIVRTLREAESKGISPKIFYDKTASSSLKSFKNAIAAQGKGLMHRKIVVVDHAQVFLGSANMTSPSLRFHDNLVVGLYHPGLATFLEEDSPPSPYHFAIDGLSGELWLLPESKNTALGRLVTALDAAREKIRVAIFTITHPTLAEALIRAHQRGVSVKVAVDFFTEKGSSRQVIDKLYQAGIPIYCSQGAQLLHHKWILIDSSTLIMGSTNLTKAAFSQNKEFFLTLSPLPKKAIKFTKNLWRTIQLESKKKTD